MKRAALLARWLIALWVVSWLIPTALPHAVAQPVSDGPRPVAADSAGYTVSQQKRAAAEDALAAVDEIFQKVSEISGLSIKSKVKSAVVSREQIREHIARRLKEANTPADLHAQEAAFIKFGLLPQGFELEKFLIELLAEQATAFYDPKQKQFFLSDWAPLDLQRPAIAHELTHALQDQHIDLDAFLQKKDLTQDEQTARMAVIEGEAVLSMMEFIMAPMGMKVSESPDLTRTISEATAVETAKFPVFGSAPLYLRESLLFPYTAGLAYVQAKGRGKGNAVYAMLLKSPPKSSHEVMHPDEPALPPLDLKSPEISKASTAGYKKLDTDALGELDISVLLKTMVSESAAQAIAPAWRGLRYEIYENAKGETLLAHRSKWKDAESAQAFAEAYRKVIAKKSGEAESRVEVRGDTVDVWEGLKVSAGK